MINSYMKNQESWFLWLYLHSSLRFFVLLLKNFLFCFSILDFQMFGINNEMTGEMNLNRTNLKSYFWKPSFSWNACFHYVCCFEFNWSMALPNWKINSLKKNFNFPLSEVTFRLTYFEKKNKTIQIGFLFFFLIISNGFLNEKEVLFDIFIF